MGPKMKNNASIFEARGDPWVSQRDAIRDFRRDPEHEDPDMDQFTRALHLSKDDQREERERAGIFGRSTPPKVKKADTNRKAKNVVYAMHQKLRRNNPGMIVVESRRNAYKHPCSICHEAFGKPHKANCSARTKHGQRTVGGE